MKNKVEERRKYPRYDTEIKIYFRVNYSLKTKVEFQLISAQDKKMLSKKYWGLSKDVSVEGLRFCSAKKLRKGNRIYLEMYLPKSRQPVWMIGQVRWSKKLDNPRVKYQYDTGLKLKNVMGEPVSKSIYFDKKYKVFWSSVLNYAFGSFRKLKNKKGNT